MLIDLERMPEDGIEKSAVDVNRTAEHTSDVLQKMEGTRFSLYHWNTPRS
jgi:hypothetical protein